MINIQIHEKVSSYIIYLRGSARTLYDI